MSNVLTVPFAVSPASLRGVDGAQLIIHYGDVDRRRNDGRLYNLTSKLSDGSTLHQRPGRALGTHRL